MKDKGLITKAKGKKGEEPIIQDKVKGKKVRSGGQGADHQGQGQREAGEVVRAGVLTAKR